MSAKRWFRQFRYGVAGSLLLTLVAAGSPAVATDEVATESAGADEGVITARLTDRGCNPVSTQVDVLRRGAHGMWHTVRSDFSDPAGLVTFKVPAGDYVLQYGFDHPRFPQDHVVEYSGDALRIEDAVPVTVTPGTKVTADAQMAVGGQIEGNVGTRDGWALALPFTAVEAHRLTPSGERSDISLFSHVMTDGTYLIDQLPAGLYELELSNADFGIEPVVFPQGPVRVKHEVRVSGADFRLSHEVPGVPDPAPATKLPPPRASTSSKNFAQIVDLCRTNVRASLRAALDSVRLATHCRWSKGSNRHRQVRIAVRRGRGLVDRVEVRLGKQKLASGTKTPFRVQRRASALRRIGEPVGWRGYRKVRARVHVELAGKRMQRRYVVNRPRCLR